MKDHDRLDFEAHAMKKIVNTKYCAIGIVLLAFISLIFYGCGGPIGVLETGSDVPAGSGLVNIKGKIVAPLAENISNRPAAEAMYNLSSVQGTRVFIESLPSCSAVADANGDFLIRDVPFGSYSIIAEKTEGLYVYKQRQENILVTSTEDTMTLTSYIPLEAAPYELTVYVEDLNAANPLNGTAKLWGSIYAINSGCVTFNAFPGGSSRKDAVIQIPGYNAVTVPLWFGSNRKSNTYVKLTSTTSASGNMAPIVAIEQAYDEVKISILNGNKIRLGDVVTLCANMGGVKGGYTLNWQTDGGTGEWRPVTTDEGSVSADGLLYAFQSSKENIKNRYRVLLVLD